MMAATKTIQRKIGKMGITRFSKASGTHDPAEWKQMGVMLDDLIEQNESVCVWALHRGRLSFPHAYPAWQKKGVRGVRELLVNISLEKESFERYVSEQDWSERTKLDHLYNFDVLLKYARKHDRMTDLPDVLRRFKADVLKRQADPKRKRRSGRRMFNYARRTALQWIRATQGKSSDTYQEIVEKVKELKPDARAPRKYLSPADVQFIINRMPPRAGAMFWTMATTGAGPKELVEDGVECRDGGVFINGEKCDHRKRLVPLLYEPAPVCLQYSGLRYHLERAIKGTEHQGRVNLYDFRRAYPRWLLKAGVDYDRVMQYQGHAEQTTTDIYLFSDVRDFLADDAIRVREWIEAERIKTKIAAA